MRLLAARKSLLVSWVRTRTTTCIDGSYFVIERRVGITWKYYTADNNPDTFFEVEAYRHFCFSGDGALECSGKYPKGQYRIRYYGNGQEELKDYYPV